jgi:hypothetical protein
MTHSLPEAQNSQNIKYNADYMIKQSRKRRIDDAGRLHIKGHRVGRISAIGVIGDVTQKITDPTDLKEGILAIIHAWEKMFYQENPWSGQPARSFDVDSFPIPRIAIVFAKTILRGYVRWSDEKSPAPLVERFHAWLWNLPARKN